MTNYDNLKKYTGLETIYFFSVDERYNDIFKIGRSRDILNRLRNYNVGKIKETDLKFLALVKNSILIENCIKNKLFDKKIFENKELYKIDAEIIKKVIDKCYCENVSLEENQKMYDEIADLLKFYNYSKNKVNIKPYIIIDK